MKKYILIPYFNSKGDDFLNWELMNRVDYSKPGIIKGCLYRYDNLMKLALNGDQVAQIVCLDIKRAIHTKGVLTFKQRRYLSLWWQGFTTIDIATMYKKKHSTVVLTMQKGIANISSFLHKKSTKTPLSVPNYRRGKYA